MFQIFTLQILIRFFYLSLLLFHINHARIMIVFFRRYEYILVKSLFLLSLKTIKIINI
jgi:hypothetical protein